MVASLTRVLAGALVVLGVSAPALADPPDDRILASDQYTTPKARGLAAAHGSALRALNATVYHCMPWVEVQKGSIGFFRPKELPGDPRYLSIRIYIDQDPSPAFAKLSPAERAAAMFSRYTGALLRRMGQSQALVGDTTLDGFTTILEWVKQGERGPRGNPVHETIAVFIERSTALEYLAGGFRTDELARRARVLGWDGDRPMGPLTFAAWDDDFVSKFKIKNYQLAPGVSCDPS